MTAKIARTRSTSIEYYEYEGQPREEWPMWLQAAFKTLDPNTKAGRIATAHYDTKDGEPEWYRWYDADKFWQQYEN